MLPIRWVSAVLLISTLNLTAALMGGPRMMRGGGPPRRLAQRQQMIVAQRSRMAARSRMRRPMANYNMQPANFVAYPNWQYPNQSAASAYYSHPQSQARYVQTNTQTVNDVDAEPFDPNSIFQHIQRTLGKPQWETVGLTPAWNLTDPKWTKIKNWSQSVADATAEPEK